MKRFLMCFLFSATLFAQDAAKKLPIKTEVGPSAPRYQLFVNPNVRADTFLLDTVTGKIWLRTSFVNYAGEPDVWVAQDRVDDDYQMAAWSKSHFTKEQAHQLLNSDASTPAK